MASFYGKQKSTEDNIKVILFDLGMVIIDLFPPRTISAFAELANKREAEIERVYQQVAIFQ